jgi:hypothetical protein
VPIKLVRADPPGGGRRDPTITVCLLWAHTLGLCSLVGDGPATYVAGTIAWALLVLVTLAES